MADVFQSHSIMPFLLSTPIWLISFAAAIDRGFLVANFNFLSLALIVFSEALLKYLIAVGMVELNLHAYIYAAIPLSMIIPFLFGWKKSQGLTSSNKVRTSYLQYFPSKFFSTSLLMGLAGIGFLSFDIILAKYYLDPTSAGYYTLLSLVGKMIYFVGMLFAEFTFPIVSRAEGAGKNTLKAYLPLFIVATFFVTGAYVVLGPLGELTAPFLLGDKAFPILNYLSKYTLALTIYTIATLIVDYHMSLRHYTFPATGFVLAVTQIIALSIFHQDLAMFINIILVLSGLYLFLVSVTHIFYGTVVVIEKNVTDFLDLFVLKLNGKKKLSKGKLRILIFNWRDIRHMWAGGAEVYVHELAKRWVSRGHKVTVFSGNDGKSKRNEVIDGVNIFRRGGFYTVYLWAFMYYIFRFRRRYDVVVESENGVPFFTPLYSTKPKILVVHHVHQEVFMEHLKFPLSFIARFVESRLVPLIYNNQRIVAVSESTKADIIANNIATDDRIEIVSPGIDTKLYKRTRKTTYPSFIYLGRHKAYKNIGTIILAFKGVLTKYPEAKLFIAGDGDTTWSLKELAKKQGIRKSVYFLGKVSDEEKVRLLGKSWVSLQPSSFEGWGITVLEANACGTPVIASNVKGLRDSVVDGKTGILVPVKNVNLFEKVMLELISNNLLRKELSDQAYEWSKLFEWDKTSEKFMSVIKNNLKVKKSLNINSGNFAYIEEKK
jgi:glycosyltransferase involved in cell wall biosynthesis